MRRFSAVAALSQVSALRVRQAIRMPAARGYHNISVEQGDNGVAHLSLDREYGKNALSMEMVTEIDEAVKKLAADSTVKTLIVSSAVENVFCAGADLKERVSMTNEEVEAFVTKLRDSFQGLASTPFPTIAVIEGAALGGGLELALACDIRVAGTNAILGLPETALGIIPGAGGTQRLPRLVGVGKAKELILTATRLNGRAAFEIGLVNHCVEAGDALITAEGIALSIVKNAPIALRMAKLAVDKGVGLDLAAGLEVEGICYGQVVGTDDRREGIASFVQKRKPVYKGR
jgi:methylglutaconyl-CoA hydratase